MIRAVQVAAGLGRSRRWAGLSEAGEKPLAMVLELMEIGQSGG